MAGQKNILCINAGSSSVKVTLFKADHGNGSAADVGNLEQLAAAEISDIASSPMLTYEYCGLQDKTTQDISCSIQSQDDAFKYILKTFLDDKSLRAVHSSNDLDYACHRVVHGVCSFYAPSDG